VKGALAVALALLQAATAGAAERPEATRAERESVGRVFTALERKDCATAVQRLNQGLAEKYIDIYMLAGSMYEEGLCLKSNWERAVQMYLQADRLGHRGAWARLVAGYADQGRDPASALWWASRRGGMGLPRTCLLPSGLWDDPEAVVATLRAWPRGQLEQCLYAAGVMAMVTGDVEFPSVPLTFELNAHVVMRFVPAEASIDWKTVEVEALPVHGVVRGDYQRDRSSRQVRASFETYLRELGERALKRYAKPAEMPSDWQVDSHFFFRLVD
jgi:hypothetical protein